MWGRRGDAAATSGDRTVAQHQTILMAETPIPSPASKPRRAPLRLLYVGTAFLILVLLSTNVAVILHLRKSELRDQEGQQKRLSLILAEQADRSFQAVDLVISSVAEGIAARGVTDSTSFNREMAGRDIHLLLREKMSGVPQLDAVLVMSREGKLINFSRFWPAPEIDISDRAYFRAMQADPNLQTYVTEPIQTRVTGNWTIFLARRVNGPNGEFLGLILGAIEMRYFEDFYQAISTGKGGTISLQKMDGQILARFPQTATIGKVFSNSDRLLPNGTAGTMRELSPIDGQMRLKAAHRLTNYPVFVLATRTEEAALASWRGIARLLTLCASGCAISIAIAGFAFGRQWKQQARLAHSQAELRRHEDRAAAMGAAADVARATALEMLHSAEHDFLTGLPNRLLLNDRIGQAITAARRNKKTVAVLFLDLDGFKHINDSLGHAVGDKLLQSIAKRLVDCVRASDTVSRQGGDEFVVLLSEVEKAEDAAIATRRIVETVTGPHAIDEHDIHVHAAIAAGRMLNAVAGSHLIDNRDLHVTASIGVSVYPDDGLDAETLIKNADTAMYQAKEHGRQSYRFFEPKMSVRAVERQSIEADLRRAVERHEFLLHYQPVIDLATGAITGAEALIRWMRPTRGLVPPLQFIPVAEDSGLIVPIGAWVMREACRQTRAWVDAGLPAMTVAVNVSAMEFRDENFLENLFSTLGDTGVDPKSLVVELTESVLMKHAEAAASVLQAVRQVGIRVAIDDFGTGYSSLGYLRRFPLDALKIDQSFVRQISIAGEDTAIVTAVIGMARSLKLRIIAEGVETLEQLEFLQAHHCDEAQGYYFSRPVPAEQFARLLRSGIPDHMAARSPAKSAKPSPTAHANSDVSN
jgi:diguanylate cyclase (GGDEF)-like protein